MTSIFHAVGELVCFIYDEMFFVMWQYIHARSWIHNKATEYGNPNQHVTLAQAWLITKHFETIPVVWNEAHNRFRVLYWLHSH